MESKTNYEDRLTIFIDILGFKNLLSHSEKKIDNKYVDDVEVIKQIQEIYSDIFFHLNFDKPNHLVEDKQVSIFSDCIAISIKLDEQMDFLYLFSAIKSMVISLLKKNIVCRGAITYGKLIHTKDYIFGPALVEAYILESKSANYPRIIIDESIFSMINNNKYITFFKEYFFTKDLDGMYYLDYFGLILNPGNKLNRIVDVFKDEKETLIFISNLKKFISDSLKKLNRYNHADIRVKYVWMREKLNECIRIINSSESSVDRKLLKEYKLTTVISSRRDY